MSAPTPLLDHLALASARAWDNLERYVRQFGGRWLGGPDRGADGGKKPVEQILSEMRFFFGGPDVIGSIRDNTKIRSFGKVEQRILGTHFFPGPHRARVLGYVAGADVVKRSALTAADFRPCGHEAHREVDVDAAVGFLVDTD